MNHEGQSVPQVTFRTQTDNDWKNVSSDELFKGKTVVVFSLPDGNANRSRIVGAITGAGTVPQIFVNGQRIGGLEELQKWNRKAA